MTMTTWKVIFIMLAVVLSYPAYFIGDWLANIIWGPDFTYHQRAMIAGIIVALMLSAIHGAFTGWLEGKLPNDSAGEDGVSYTVADIEALRARRLGRLERPGTFDGIEHLRSDLLKDRSVTPRSDAQNSRCTKAR